MNDISVVLTNKMVTSVKGYVLYESKQGDEQGIQIVSYIVSNLNNTIPFILEF